ncbi:MAG TPA: TIGR01777 family oxidoreductase [Roseiflexaceae bacterium]|nr:TIGR01777 family oxidoreductase [Roseiflexaceae bacterium]
MKIVIPGGSGQVGTLLARAFSARGDEVVVLSRQPANAPWRTVAWDAVTVGSWASEFEGADVVINLAGRSVNCRYTAENRRQILDSRVYSTQAVGKAIAQATCPPRIWLQASTATIYGHRFEAVNDEAGGLIDDDAPGAPPSWRFSVTVAKAWEEAAIAAATPQTRKILLRSAMIMSPDRDGIFDTLLRLVRFGLGGPAGDGRQYVSWLHDHDFVRAVEWLISRSDLDGPVNLASPNPLPYRAFMRALRSAWGIPIGLPATRLMVEIGAFLLRTESELALKSRRVVPGRLLASGFAFNWPEWPAAARDLCDRWRGTGKSRL